VKKIASASFEALGTTAAVFVTEPNRLMVSRELLEEELLAIDRSCSRFRPDSELSQVNAAEGRAIRVSALFIEAVDVALRAARVTDGLVDPTVGRAMRAIGYDRDFELIPANRSRPASGAVVPGWQAIQVDRTGNRVRIPPGVELDFGATGKALAADRAARRIEAELATGVLVNLGGDVAVAGEAPSGGWRIRISDDHRDHTEPHGEIVSIRVGGLATSSTTVRRWKARGGMVHHIIDPRRGASAAIVWRTASVAAASCVDANTASTAAIVSGHEAPAWLEGLSLPSRLVCRHGRVHRVGAWPQRSG
jgi:thiamine biosynthesis lipoprotein